MTRPPSVAFIALSVTLAVSIIQAQPIAAETILIQNGTVHTITSPPHVADVLIEDGRIVAVETGLSAAPGAIIIDATDQIVTPGLVDIRAAVGLIEVSSVDQTVDEDGGGDPIRAALRVADAINPQSTLIGVARLEGITSVVAHPSGGLIAGQSVWIDLYGDRVDEMVVLNPATMTMQGGAGAAAAVGAGSRAAAILRYRELFADAQFLFENGVAFDSGQLRELSASYLDLLALEPVLQGELVVMISVSQQADILNALELADEWGLSLIIEGGQEAWAVADALALAGVPVVVNALRNAPYGFDQLGARDDNAALLDAAGVPVILSTFSAHWVRTLRQHAGNAVRAGLDWDSALAAITLQPARALGLDEQYGSLEPGKVANVVVWSGDPFEFSSRATSVIIRGELVPLESRQTELLERYRDL